jgi:hypothetical protein
MTTAVNTTTQEALMPIILPDADTLATRVIAASHDAADAEQMRGRIVSLIDQCEAHGRRDIVDDAFWPVGMCASMALSRLTSRMMRADLDVAVVA